MTEIFILFLEKMDECRKSHFNDYSFNQTSLEQIFINFVKKQIIQKKKKKKKKKKFNNIYINKFII